MRGALRRTGAKAGGADALYSVESPRRRNGVFGCRADDPPCQPNSPVRRFAQALVPPQSHSLAGADVIRCARPAKLEWMRRREFIAGARQRGDAAAQMVLPVIGFGDD
jgi:hypothetical protein